MPCAQRVYSLADSTYACNIEHILQRSYLGLTKAYRETRQEDVVLYDDHSRAETKL
jgi:hypothetical protein